VNIINYIKNELKKRRSKFYISKYELAKSEHRYFRYLYRERPEGAMYWYEYKENQININTINAVPEEELFFANEKDIFDAEGDYGDYFAEVIFDKKDKDFRKLEKWYFCEGWKLCGHTLKIGKIIKVGDVEYENLKQKYRKK